jgi:hypothetical protein
MYFSNYSVQSREQQVKGMLTDCALGHFDAGCHSQWLGEWVESWYDDLGLGRGDFTSGGVRIRRDTRVRVWRGAQSKCASVHKGSPIDRPWLRVRRRRVSGQGMSHAGSCCLRTGNGGMQGGVGMVLVVLRQWAECMERVFWLGQRPRA